MALSDKAKKKIIADYAQCQNYREVARLHGVSDGTVRNIVNKDAEITQKCAQKREENTQSVLEYMDQQTSTKKRILEKLLLAIEQKAENVDMFTNIKDLATAYGIVFDKEVKALELKKATEKPEGITIHLKRE
jgi:hypothetical protein